MTPCLGQLVCDVLRQTSAVGSYSRRMGASSTSMGKLNTHRFFYVHCISKNEIEVLSFVKYSHILTKEIKLMECHNLVYDVANFIAGNFKDD